MLFNFTRFIDKVRDGTKPHTIRRLSKRPPPDVGGKLHLYEKARTTEMKLIIPECLCLGVQPIEMRLGWNDIDNTLIGTIKLAGVELSPLQMLRLIWSDGFRIGPVSDLRSFYDFFVVKGTSGIEFDGYLISWAQHSLLSVGSSADSAHEAWLKTLQRPGRIPTPMPNTLVSLDLVVQRGGARL